MRDAITEIFNGNGRNNTIRHIQSLEFNLCMAASDMKEMQQLKEKCVTIILQLIIGFNQLRAILASIKEEPTEELKRDLAKWLSI